MTITFRLTFRDRLAFNGYHMLRSPMVMGMLGVFFLLITFWSVLPAIRSLPNEVPLAFQVAAFTITEIIVVVALVGGIAVVAVLTMISRRNKTLYCEKRITLSEEAIVGESEYGRSETRWKMVQKLARTRSYIFIYMAAESAVVIPRRAFASPSQWDEFFEICRQRSGSAG